MVLSGSTLIFLTEGCWNALTCPQITVQLQTWAIEKSRAWNKGWHKLTSLSHFSPSSLFPSLSITFSFKPLQYHGVCILLHSCTLFHLISGWNKASLLQTYLIRWPFGYTLIYQTLIKTKNQISLLWRS